MRTIIWVFLLMSFSLIAGNSICHASPFSPAEEDLFIQNAVSARIGVDDPSEISNYRAKVAQSLGSLTAHPLRRNERRTGTIVLSSLMSASELAFFADNNGLEVMVAEGHMPSTSGGPIYSFAVRDIPVFEGTLLDRLAFFRDRHELLVTADNALRNVEDPNRTVATKAAANAVAVASQWFVVIDVISTHYGLNELLTDPNVDTVILGANNAEIYDKWLANFTPLPRDLLQFSSHYPGPNNQSSDGKGFNGLGESVDQTLALPELPALCGPSSPYDQRCPMQHMYSPNWRHLVGGRSSAYGYHFNWTLGYPGLSVHMSSMTTGDTLRWGNTPASVFTDPPSPIPFGTAAFRGDLEPKCDLQFHPFSILYTCGSGGNQENGLFVEDAGFEAEVETVDSECPLSLRTGTVVDMFAGCFYPFSYLTSFPSSASPYLDTTVGDSGDEYSATVGIRYGDRLVAGEDYENTVFTQAVGVHHTFTNAVVTQGGQISTRLGSCNIGGPAFCMYYLDHDHLNTYPWVPVF